MAVKNRGECIGRSKFQLNFPFAWVSVLWVERALRGSEADLAGVPAPKPSRSGCF